MACDSDAVRVLVLRRHHPVRISVIALPTFVPGSCTVLCAECLLPRRMNVLIAIMADSYEMVKEHEKVEALHERAKMIADMELLHPGWHRFSTYMHVCEAADEDNGLEPEWAGVAGRVKVLLAESTQQLQLRMDKQQEEVATLRMDIARLPRAPDIAALRSEVAEIKALILQNQTAESGKATSA